MTLAPFSLEDADSLIETVFSPSDAFQPKLIRSGRQVLVKL